MSVDHSILLLQCLGDSNCGTGECCVEITCSSIEKNPKVEKVSVCSSIPQSGDPCDLGSMGTALSCPCGQNLSCSHSESTRYGYHREKYYKCLCRYPEDSKKCDKYKNDMRRYQNKPGSVCRETTSTEPVVSLIITIVMLSTYSCSDYHCLLAWTVWTHRLW